MNRLAACGMAVIVTVGGAVSCSSPSTVAGRDTTAVSVEPVPPPAPGTPVITIVGMGYSAPITVAPGAKITIVNDDEVAHTVTSRTKGQFDVYVAGNHRAILTAPAEPGNYGFYCIYHPAMISTLTVK